MSHDTLGDRTNDLVALNDTHRWTVVPTLRTQSVAEHSFNVAVIAAELAQRLGVMLHHMEEVLWWSLIHDMPEIYTGDVDGRMKREFPEVKNELSAVESIKFPLHSQYRDVIPPMVVALVKVADTIEAITFIKRWGHGGRAEDVFWELTALLPTHIDAMCDAMGMDNEPEGRAAVYYAVHFVRDHSLSDVNSIQLRHRRKEVREQSGKA